MSVRPRKNGTFIADVVIADGRRFRQVAGTKKEARALETRFRAIPPIPKRGLEEALARYLDGRARQLGSYNSLLSKANAIRDLIAGKTIDEAPDVAEKIRETYRHLKPATVNRRLALLRRLCYLAHEWGWTDQLYGRRIKLLPEHNERHVYLLPAQVEALAVAAGDHGDFIRLAAYTGLRKGELLGLTPENVDDGAIVLYRTKNATPRVVPVPSRLRYLLDGLPFPVNDRSLRVAFEKARQAIGMPELHFHDLRHTYASLLAAQGVSDPVMRELLGHKSTQMIKRYAHLRADHLRRVVDGL